MSRHPSVCYHSCAVITAAAGTMTILFMFSAKKGSWQNKNKNREQSKNEAPELALTKEGQGMLRVEMPYSLLAKRLSENTRLARVTVKQNKHLATCTTCNSIETPYPGVLNLQK